jgi:hypothetical protein
MHNSGTSVSAVSPYLHVADVEAAGKFYELLGLVRDGEFRDPTGRLCWLTLARAEARVMLALASGPIAADVQAALLYMYCPDVKALRQKLLAAGVKDGGKFETASHSPVQKGVAFEISRPPYMPQGELRLHDADGYVILIGQHG